MSDLRNLLTIRNCLGGASFVSGLICFAFGSTYDELFGKLGFGGRLIYVGIGLLICYLIWGVKRIRVPQRFKRVVEAILFVVICFISVKLDKLKSGNSDTLSVISYGLFALMAASTSRKSELGFETGFFSFFLSLFLTQGFKTQVFKTKWNLLPIALVFCLVAILLRHRSESGSPNGDCPEQEDPLIPVLDNIDNYDVEGQGSWGSLSLENNPEESSEAMHHHSPSNYGQVPEGSILEVANLQHIQQEETDSSLTSRRHHSASNNGQVSEGSTSENRESEQSNEQEEDHPSSSFTHVGHQPQYLMQMRRHSASNNGQVSEESTSVNMESYEQTSISNEQEEDHPSSSFTQVGHQPQYLMQRRRHSASNNGQVSEGSISKNRESDEHLRRTWNNIKFHQETTIPYIVYRGITMTS